MSDLDDITTALNSLQLRHQEQLTQLLSEQRVEEARLVAQLHTAQTNNQPIPTVIASAISPPRARSVSPPPAPCITDRFGEVLHIGDKVSLLSSAQSGKVGDLAKVVKFSISSTFVIVKLRKTGTVTQRIPRNLRRCPQPPWHYTR